MGLLKNLFLPISDPLDLARQNFIQQARTREMTTATDFAIRPLFLGWLSVTVSCTQIQRSQMPHSTHIVVM
jgi:hypothetical protein